MIEDVKHNPIEDKNVRYDYNADEDRQTLFQNETQGKSEDFSLENFLSLKKRTPAEITAKYDTFLVNRAKRLADVIQKNKQGIKRTKALEEAARYIGFKDWNRLNAASKAIDLKGRLSSTKLRDAFMTPSSWCFMPPKMRILNDIHKKRCNLCLCEPERIKDFSRIIAKRTGFKEYFIATTVKDIEQFTTQATHDNPILLFVTEGAIKDSKAFKEDVSLTELAKSFTDMANDMISDQDEQALPKSTKKFQVEITKLNNWEFITLVVIPDVQKQNNDLYLGFHWSSNIFWDSPAGPALIIQYSEWANHDSREKIFEVSLNKNDPRSEGLRVAQNLEKDAVLVLYSTSMSTEMIEARRNLYDMLVIGAKKEQDSDFTRPLFYHCIPKKIGNNATNFIRYQNEAWSRQKPKSLVYVQAGSSEKALRLVRAAYPSLRDRPTTTIQIIADKEDFQSWKTGSVQHWAPGYPDHRSKGITKNAVFSYPDEESLDKIAKRISLLEKISPIIPSLPIIKDALPSYRVSQLLKNANLHDIYRLPSKGSPDWFVHKTIMLCSTMKGQKRIIKEAGLYFGKDPVFVKNIEDVNNIKQDKNIIIMDDLDYINATPNFKNVLHKKESVILRRLIVDETSRLQPIYNNIHRYTAAIMDTCYGPVIAIHHGFAHKENENLNFDDLDADLGKIHEEGSVIIFDESLGPYMGETQVFVSNHWSSAYRRNKPYGEDITIIPRDNFIEKVFERGFSHKSEKMNVYTVQAASHEEAVAVTKGIYPNFKGHKGLMTIHVGSAGDGITEWTLRDYKIW